MLEFVAYLNVLIPKIISTRLLRHLIRIKHHLPPRAQPRPQIPVKKGFIERRDLVIVLYIASRTKSRWRVDADVGVTLPAAVSLVAVAWQWHRVRAEVMDNGEKTNGRRDTSIEKK